MDVPFWLKRSPWSLMAPQLSSPSTSLSLRFVTGSKTRFNIITPPPRINTWADVPRNVHFANIHYKGSLQRHEANR